MNIKMYNDCIEIPENIFKYTGVPTRLYLCYIILS